MRTYILIGGIGAGKSTVAALLAEHGACTLDLDKVGHEVLGIEEVRARLVERFGEAILDEDGAISRPALASCAFATDEATADLNAITHPAIVKRAQLLLDKMRHEGCQVAVVEISAYEGPGGAFDPLVDAADGVIVVSTPAALRVYRAIAHGIDELDVQTRINRQATEVERLSWGDIFVTNEGTIDELAQRVDELWDNLSGEPA